ncbi:hypothetical protein PISMIDRAFT_680405 [Pisolithus microcarpus 441]|uniref:Uncharacterized protein n=1 Tax=Pisolithus microcarpus 441 TaxID=765257 RepID=A0A0C9Z8N0_9AGAM|nr:hypothetical protein PISMIDRAFT_680405 [Pisolithus microcarpus 441]
MEGTEGGLSLTRGRVWDLEACGCKWAQARQNGIHIRFFGMQSLSDDDDEYTWPWGGRHSCASKKKTRWWQVAMQCVRSLILPY